MRPETPNISSAIPLFTLSSAWSVLEQSGWLAGRSPEARALFYGLARLRTVEAGEVIYRHGDAADGLYGLVRGGLDISIPRVDGQEVIVHRAQPGFWIGDLALFAGQKKRLVTVRAASSASLVHLPKDRLHALIADHTALMADFYELSHENFATLLVLLGNLAVSGAQDRVAIRLLVQHDALANDEDWIHVSQEALAELVALSPQSVRRALRQLEEQRLIEAAYGRIRVIDYTALAERCGYAAARRRRG